MRTTIHMRDLKPRSGFPVNLDRRFSVALLIHEEWMYSIMYREKSGEYLVMQGKTTIHWRPGLYWINGI